MHLIITTAQIKENGFKRLKIRTSKIPSEIYLDHLDVGCTVLYSAVVTMLYDILFTKCWVVVDGLDGTSE